ncbi:MAG: DUF3343 domain-containing protein [Treponema sp.]|jgi:hypothetical protein|nr:DUF3343 domain-containing protein [Treponema sp.]
MNNERAEELVFIFHSTHDAIMGERSLLNASIAVKVMPIPDCLGPACGIALRVNPEDAEEAGTLLGQNVRGIYRRLFADGNTERFVLWNP